MHRKRLMDGEQVRRDARADARELKLELGRVDTSLYGWTDMELRTLDDLVAELASDLDTVDDASPLRTQLAEVRRLRRDIDQAPMNARDALVARYSAAVQALNEASRRRR